MLLADLLICHPRWILSTFWSEAGLFTLSYSFDDKSFISYTLSVLKAVDYVLTSSLNINLIQSHQKLRSDVFNTATCYIVFIVCNQNLTHFIYIRSSQFQGLSPSPNFFLKHRKTRPHQKHVDTKHVCLSCFMANFAILWRAEVSFPALLAISSASLFIIDVVLYM